MKDNMVLIGMPGSGKSTVGVLLAKLVGYDFLDCDLLIQKSEGKKLCEIIKDSGAEYFKEVENKVNSNIKATKTVIATGGSVVYGKEAMGHLKKMGKIIYLDVSLAELYRRVTNFNTRGIVMDEGQTLEDIYNERTPLYKKYADIVVKCDNDSLYDNAKSIVNVIGEKD